MKIHLFNIANFQVDGGAMFGVVPKVLWSRVYPADENNLIISSTQITYYRNRRTYNSG